MKVEVITRSEKCLEDMDYQDRMKILVDGNVVFDVYDGEHEDNNLARNFNDCYDAHHLLRMGWRAGKAGEEFEMTISEDDGDVG